MRALLAAGLLAASLLGTAEAADLSSVFLVQDFTANPGADPGQCNAANFGRIVSPAGEWSPAIRLDTDSRGGGCLHQFAIVDLDRRITGLMIWVNFFGDGDAAQCGNPGNRVIPVRKRFDSLLFTQPMSIDTDNRGGGCQETWSVTGRNDVRLEIDFQPDGDPGQCGNAGTHLVTPGNPVTIYLDMDDRGGGCQQRFRLLSQ
jgi:hypothetical protein